jgi:hypothetical protein
MATASAAVAEPPVRFHLSRYTPYPPSAPQLAFLMLDLAGVRESFYGGAAGGGKSDALLMSALQYVHVPGYRALILRRTFKQLSKGDALIPRSHEWLHDSDAAWNEEKKTWTFPSGATLEFGHVETEAAKYDYQGAAYQFIGFDEQTQFTETMYDYIGFTRSRRRRSMKLAGVPIRVRATGNPGGEGHDWVLRRLVAAETRKPGAVFIPAKVADNPGLDVEEYAESLAGLPEALRRQLLDGDWGVFEGAAYAMFDEDLHVVAPFAIPSEWDRFEQMDYGVAAPTAWHVVATDYDGNLVVFDEYYAPGLVSEHAAAVKRRRAGGWQVKDADGWNIRTNSVFGDPSTGNRTGGQTQLGDPATIVTEFAEHGIGISKANNARDAGYMRIAELLRPDPERLFPRWHPRYGEKGAPRLFLMSCPNLIAQLKTAPVEPLDSGDPLAGKAVKKEWERQHGHAHAALRYGVMSRPGASHEPKQTSDLDPRAAYMQSRRERAIEDWKRGGPRDTTDYQEC